jgi:hypothetical protein
LIVKNFVVLEDFEIDFVNQIFFESSTVSHFKSIKQREDFQYKYLDYYKIYFPLNFFVLCDNRPLGYVCGVPDLLKVKKLFELSPHLHAFKDLYKQFPAHLHINMCAESRGKGLGPLLINEFVGNIEKSGGNGVHIITTPTAKNVSFYKKCGFNFQEERVYKESALLFMGKQLKS